MYISKKEKKETLLFIFVIWQDQVICKSDMLIVKMSSLPKLDQIYYCKKITAFLGSNNEMP